MYLQNQAAFEIWRATNELVTKHRIYMMDIYDGSLSGPFKSFSAREALIKIEIINSFILQTMCLYKVRLSWPSVVQKPKITNGKTTSQMKHVALNWISYTERMACLIQNL